MFHFLKRIWSKTDSADKEDVADGKRSKVDITEVEETVLELQVLVQGGPRNVANSEKVRNTKKPRKLAKPTKNAFFRFANANREKAKKDNPDLKPFEIQTKLSEQWNMMEENEKSPYRPPRATRGRVARSDQEK